jgi:hypothetical protein
MAYKRNPYLFRPSIESAYDKAYDYYKEENAGYYSSGSYDLIPNFSYLRNDFYWIENVVKPSYPYSNHWWSSGDGYFDYDYQVLYFKTDGLYYEIRPNDSNIKDYIIKLSSICFGVSLLLLLIIYFTNPFGWKV